MTFKIILTGITGRIGSEVLQQCLKNEKITSIVALSRRGLPDFVGKHSKLDIIIMKDFTKYDTEVVSKLAGADGCIWAMTMPRENPTLELEYPMAFAKAFSTTLAEHKKRFRYLHLTGAVVERDQAKSLWFLGGMRKLKGRGETQMVEFAKDPSTGGFWETYAARPGMVVRRGSLSGDAMIAILGDKMSIRSDELALALIDTVVNGSNEDIVQCAALVKKGQQLLKEQGQSK